MAEFEVNLSLKDGNNILTIRGKTVIEVGGVLREAAQNPDFAAFFGNPPAGAAAGQTLAAGPPVSGGTATSETAPESEVSAEDAQALVTKHLGTTEELASPALVKVAAKASGKTVEELAGISKAEALRLKKEGK